MHKNQVVLKGLFLCVFCLIINMQWTMIPPVHNLIKEVIFWNSQFLSMSL